MDDRERIGLFTAILLAGHASNPNRYDGFNNKTIQQYMDIAVTINNMSAELNVVQKEEPSSEPVKPA